MDFGERVKGLREEINLSRDELAKEFEISYSTLSKYETNGRFPDKNMLKRFSNYFDVSIDYLLGQTDVRKIHTNSSVLDVDDVVYYIKNRFSSANNIVINGEPASYEVVEGLLQGLEVSYMIAKRIHEAQKK